MCNVDYTKVEMAKWFWTRLAASLKDPYVSLSSRLSAEESARLESVRVELLPSESLSDSEGFLQSGTHGRFRPTKFRVVDDDDDDVIKKEKQHLQKQAAKRDVRRQEVRHPQENTLEVDGSYESGSVEEDLQAGAPHSSPVLKTKISLVANTSAQPVKFPSPSASGRRAASRSSPRQNTESLTSSNSIQHPSFSSAPRFVAPKSSRQHPATKAALIPRSVSPRDVTASNETLESSMELSLGATKPQAAAALLDSNSVEMRSVNYTINPAEIRLNNGENEYPYINMNDPPVPSDRFAPQSTLGRSPDDYNHDKHALESLNLSEFHFNIGQDYSMDD